MLTMLFVLASAASTGMTVNACVAFVGNHLAAHVERQRLAKLLREISQDMAVVKVSPTAVDDWVREECGPEALDPFELFEIGGYQIWCTGRQRALLETYLEDESDARLRALLTKIVATQKGGT